MVYKNTNRKKPTRNIHAMMTPTSALRYLATRKRTLDLYVQEKKEDARYGFRVGDLKLLLRPHEKVEAIETVTACPIPNTPPWFAGMINLRGNLLPVFDFELLLDMKKSGPSKWIMIFGENSNAAGIYADTLPSGITPDRPADNYPDLPEFMKDCVENILMQDDNLWLEIAFEKMFGNLRTKF